MFGYIRPLKGELKVREYEQYKAVYCGLCHALKTRYGLAARFVVNFDFSFLFMLLSEAEAGCYEYHRCVASPFQKKCCHTKDPALDDVAAYSLILTYWKLTDAIKDEGFGKRLAARLTRLMLGRAYAKARRDKPEFDMFVRERLSELDGLEREKCSSMDRPADKFAGILERCAEAVNDGTRRRVLEQLFYHTGRLVYILDAVDDLPEDAAKGEYNPLTYRYALAGGELTEEARESVLLSLENSNRAIASAFELLEPGPWTGVTGNIIYDGIPWVGDKVLSGQWRARREDIKIH